MTARIAVVTRTKDRPQFLMRCLSTVAEQSYLDWIHVIVNDAGNPLIVDQVVEPFIARAPHKYLVLHRPVSTGMEAATNHGVVNSQSEFIAVLDDDDTWDREFLQSIVVAMESPMTSNTLGVATQSWRVLERMEGEGCIELRREIYNPSLRNVSLFELAARNLFAVNAFVFRRSALEVVGYYNESLPVLGDWDFNLRFCVKFDIEVIPRPLSSFHVRDAQTAGPAANTVSSGSARHFHYMTKLQNDFLRADLAQGKFGLGFLMAQAAGVSGTHDLISNSTRALSPLNRVLKRLRGW